MWRWFKWSVSQLPAGKAPLLLNMDLSLKLLCEHKSAELYACFVYPSIGHYITHDSGVLLGTRTGSVVLPLSQSP